MPTEDSRDTPHHTPREGTSRRKPSADVNLQVEVELLRASVTKMSIFMPIMLSSSMTTTP
ncbi:unnamed protein product [Prunus armeniaca]